MAAIDPGIRHCGLSVWDSGVLTLALLVANPDKTSRGPKAWLSMAREVQAQYPLGLDTLVVELQQRDRRSFNAEDMFEVAGIAGSLVGIYDGRCKEVVGYKPRTWSRVPKAIRHSRLSLTEAEWQAVEECDIGLRHNLLDAICLGLYHLKQVGGRPNDLRVVNRSAA